MIAPGRDRTGEDDGENANDGAASMGEQSATLKKAIRKAQREREQEDSVDGHRSFSTLLSPMRHTAQALYFPVNIDITDIQAFELPHIHTFARNKVKIPQIVPKDLSKA